VNNYAISSNLTRFFSPFDSSVLFGPVAPLDSGVFSTVLGGTLGTGLSLVAIGFGKDKLSSDGIKRCMSDGILRSGSGDFEQASWMYK
jgi:hypothetical protein